jgi:hypothetical protein
MKILMTIGKRMAVACVAATFAGCAAGNPFTAPGNPSGKPVVWNCAMIQMSSPPKYACPDGKTYTAFQLRNFRESAAKRQENTVAAK